MLSTVTDTHQNTITYPAYGRDSATFLQDMGGCGHIHGTIDHDAWPTTIRWGGNSATGAPPRYQVTFVVAPRSVDTEYDGADTQFPSSSHAPHVIKQLNVIQAQVNLSNPWIDTPANWQLIRQYTLGYETNPALMLLSDASIAPGPPDPVNCPSDPPPVKCPDTVHTKLTLNSIQRAGNDGTPFPIKTTFSYNRNRGTAFYPSAGWNRLTQVDNGQGGIVTLAYENIAKGRSNNDPQ